MPTYLYKNIETGEIYELVQRMTDDRYTAHPETGAAIKRVVARPGIAFKGSGFYANDSRPAGGSEGGSSGAASGGSTPGSAASSGTSSSAAAASSSPAASTSSKGTSSKGGE